MPLRVVTWNVNSLRSVLRKGFSDWVKTAAADVICLQEVRAKLHQLQPLEGLFKGYQAVWHPAERPGYAGVAILSRFKPLHVERGLDGSADVEGRALTVDFGDFRVGSFYAPNASPRTPKIPFKCSWLNQLQKHVLRRPEKPFIIAGDLNVAHTKRDSGGVDQPLFMNGCTNEERGAFQCLLDECSLHDPIRDSAGMALLSTWWPVTSVATDVTGQSDSNRRHADGLRYDYVLIQKKYRDLVQDQAIHPEATGSDHCPVSLTVGLSTEGLAPAEETGQKSLL